MSSGLWGTVWGAKIVSVVGTRGRAGSVLDRLLEPVQVAVRPPEFLEYVLARHGLYQCRICVPGIYVMLDPATDCPQ